MSRAVFEIVYDGEALRDGTMDVRDLAPALLAIGRLVEDANRIANHDRAFVSVNMKAGGKPGSFPADLEVVVTLSRQMSALLGRSDVALAAVLLHHIGLSAVYDASKHAVLSFLGLMKVGKNREIVRQESTGEGGNVAVQFEGDNNTYVVNNITVEMYVDPRARKDAKKALEPLKRPGVDEFQVRNPDSGEVVDKVTREDLPHFDLLEESEQETETGDFVDWVTVRKSWTKAQNRKWQFETSTGAPFNAFITDESFWKKMSKDYYAPTPHAKFRVRVEWTQAADEDIEHTVVEVIDYKPAEPPPEGFDLGEPEPPLEE